MPAIGWSLQASGSARKASSTPIPRRGQWEAGPQITTHRVAPAKTQQEARTTRMLHGSLPHPVRAPSSRISGRKNVATCAPLAWKAPTHSLTFGGPCFFSRRIPVDLAQGISVYPAQPKKAASRLGLGGVGLEQRLHVWCTPGVPHLPQSSLPQCLDRATPSAV